ncbi:MAG: aminopeptidase P family protein [Pseudomonadota bacterium]
MKQNFDVKGGPHVGRDNLPKLRAELSKLGLDGFYVPHEDEYQNEYLPDANERLAWVSGFTGSFGSALILKDRAAIFIDGRYTIQAAEQTDHDLFERVDVPDPGPFGWLAQQDLKRQIIGYDPALMTPNDVETFTSAAQKAGASIQAAANNPIDLAWTDRPAQPLAPVHPHALDYSGLGSQEKRHHVAEVVKETGADAVVITAPASIAWLFNIRGGDVSCSPLPLARAILRSDGTATLFMAPEKETDGLREFLGNEVSLVPIDTLESELETLKGSTVSLDPGLASAWFFQTLEQAGAKIVRAQDPVLLPKACKNATELAGTAAAHRRDGAAVTRFLHWLDTEAQSGKFTEIDAALKLLDFRTVDTSMKDMSFETISGAGPNGALPHYRVSSASNRPLERGTLYLVDSGGQYPDGTTDITRTVPIGDPSDDMKRHYTLVLKGHIAMDRVRFPEGTTGTHLDTLARHALWQAGLDYDHGTGHGVGVYLGVHEGPQRIAKAWNATPLMPGMIVSNEPGFYKEGAYGIRIENLQYVTPPEEIEGGDRAMLGFECLTFAPLARGLIETSLLSAEDRDWVDDYHQRVMAEIGDLVDGEAAEWLQAACAPL